jgi:beta-glucuronidase
MPKLPLTLLLAALALAVPAGTAAAQSTVTTPSKKVLYDDGHTNRFIMDGPWLFRRSTSAPWKRITVPNAWNATDESPASMRGGVAFYRKDFRLPSSSPRLTWIVRFLSVNYRARVTLNGRTIGRHTGASIPWELTLPRNLVRRGGTNRLIIRVDSKRSSSDLPPAGLNRSSQPIGGWWNYGGLLREVELRSADRAAIDTAQVLPTLPCRSCAAKVAFNVRVKNLTRRRQRVAASARFGGRPVSFSGGTTLGPRGTGVLRGRITVPSPKLWSPRSPNLYDASIDLRIGGRVVNGYRVRTGIRSIKVSGGRLTLNGRPINPRGFGLHEDDRRLGMAVTNGVRDQLLADVRAGGGSMIRSHYPLHPHVYERADELGMLAWAEVPVYGLKTAKLGLGSLRRRGAAMVRDSVETNANHPSIVTWSIANELSPKPGPSQMQYIRLATRRARAVDRTRPFSMAIQAFPEAGCRRSAYRPIALLGLNEYFGWYTGPNAQIADRNDLSGYLDRVRRCYPDKALMITEFGFEANRSGPVEEKGTYQFQQDAIRFHHGVFASKAWLSGALYWTIKEFRVKPRWEGGNPRPQPPIHQKGVIDFDGHRKPGFATVLDAFRRVDQYPGE